MDVRYNIYCPHRFCLIFNLIFKLTVCAAGIDDPEEQDRLLSATSVLKRDVKEDASDHLEVRNRHLTRMDSGYYDGLR